MARTGLRTRVLGTLLISVSLLGTACSAASTTTASPTTAATSEAVTAGVQIGTARPAPSGWAPPSKITPLSSLPGTFQSVGDMPAQPAAKVRVFFLGMQW